MRIIKAKEFNLAQLKELKAADKVVVEQIIRQVRKGGDSAVRDCTEKFDNVKLEDLRVSKEEIKKAYDKIDKELLTALQFAIQNLTDFATSQLEQFKDFEQEIRPGVFAGQKVTPIERAGIYVPGGRFPLPSSALMGAVPARVAGVKEIALFSPPSWQNTIHPAILVAADLTGITEIYRIGGVQAIAAAAYGTNSVKPVDIIVGPGNKYVTEAKRQVFGKIGIDFLAGPSEVLIIADKSANPRYIAADLLAQAEHDCDAVSILSTDSEELAMKVQRQISLQLAELENAQTAEKAIAENGLIILTDNIEQCVSIANQIAPEHLEIQTENYREIAEQCRHFGSLFVGENSVEALGDYIAGTNHVLPTARAARYTAGLSVVNFLRLQTSLRLEKDGLAEVGRQAIKIAKTEGLEAHANSVQVRLEE